MTAHPADAIIYGTCARCGESEEDHTQRKDEGGTEWLLCPDAFGVACVGTEPPVIEDIDWEFVYDEERAGDYVG